MAPIKKKEAATKAMKMKMRRGSADDVEVQPKNRGKSRLLDDSFVEHPKLDLVITDLRTVYH